LKNIGDKGYIWKIKRDNKGINLKKKRRDNVEEKNKG
jgi:hypothetical protein